MVCYHPLHAVLPVDKDVEGKRSLIIYDEYSLGKFENLHLVCKDHVWYEGSYNHFGKGKINDDGFIYGYDIRIPCGKCIGCRLDYSRSWAIRSIHEAKLHDKNCFVTLTFDDDHLPDDKSLNKAYFSSWMKRFRKKFGEGIRFVACGEYGDKFKRPHYHVLFFNFDFPDKYVWTTRHGQVYFRSDMLEEVWRDACTDVGNGYSVIGNVDFESAAYVARYVTKKFSSKSEEMLKKHYKGREPEFLLMSRDPGIGHDFIVKNYEHIFNNGFVVIKNGHKAPIPRYYKSVVEQINPDFYERFRLDREREMIDNLFVEDINSTQERLEVREELQKLKLDKLVRAYEFDALLHNI